MMGSQVNSDEAKDKNGVLMSARYGYYRHMASLLSGRPNNALWNHALLPRLYDSFVGRELNTAVDFMLYRATIITNWTGGAIRHYGFSEN